MKINIKNQDKIQAALDAEQANARVRTASASDIEALVNRIEHTLKSMLHKKDWIGLRFILDPNGQQFANAYNGYPQSTHAEIERCPSGWFVTRVIRRCCATHEIQPTNIIQHGKQLAKHAASPAVWS